jgi:DNA-binding NarL/FixJ family response regulator
MNILLIEDDYNYFQELKSDLENDPEIARNGVQIVLIETERMFGEDFEKIAKAEYDFAIVDVMVKWEGRDSDRKRPSPDVLQGGYYRAGFRCLQTLRDDPRTSKLRVVVHSNLDERYMGDLRKEHTNPYTKFVPKSGSPEPLLDAVRSWIVEPNPVLH